MECGFLFFIFFYWGGSGGPKRYGCWRLCFFPPFLLNIGSDSWCCQHCHNVWNQLFGGSNVLWKMKLGVLKGAQKAWPLVAMLFSSFFFIGNDGQHYWHCLGNVWNDIILGSIVHWKVEYKGWKRAQKAWLPVTIISPLPHDVRWCGWSIGFQGGLERYARRRPCGFPFSTLEMVVNTINIDVGLPWEHLRPNTFGVHCALKDEYKVLKMTQHV